MSMVPVVSSNIAAVGYDEQARSLTIQFRGGSVFIYDDVPTELHDQLMAAESPGKFFAANIRDAFDTRSVSSDEKAAADAGATDAA